MLETIMVAILQGASQALTERFIRGRDTSATVRSLVADVEHIREAQDENHRTVTELTQILAEVVERTDGLEIHGQEVILAPTERTPDAESALLNLDLEISRLRLESRDDSHLSGADDSPTAAAEPESTIRNLSIFDGLDEEISRLRYTSEEKDDRRS